MTKDKWDINEEKQLYREKGPFEKTRNKENDHVTCNRHGRSCTSRHHRDQNLWPKNFWKNHIHNPRGKVDQSLP